MRKTVKKGRRTVSVKTRRITLVFFFFFFFFFGERGEEGKRWDLGASFPQKGYITIEKQ